MVPVDVVWTKQVNKLIVKCNCGNVFFARMDRFKIVCSRCYKTDTIVGLRNILSRGNYEQNT